MTANDLDSLENRLQGRDHITLDSLEAEQLICLARVGLPDETPNRGLYPDKGSDYPDEQLMHIAKLYWCAMECPLDEGVSTVNFGLDSKSDLWWREAVKRGLVRVERELGYINFDINLGASYQ
jgi:hypothetical protein